MEPIEYARLIRRRWRIVAACALVSAVLVWVTTSSRPADQLPEFVAEHTLLRDIQAENTQQALATVGLYMKTGEVPKRVAARVGFEGSPSLLARNLNVKIDETLGTVEIRATANGRDAAAELANAFAEETLGRLGEQALEARQKTNDALLATLTQSRAAIDDLDRQIAAASSAGRSPDLIVAQRDAALRAYSADFERQQEQANQPPPTAGYSSLEAASPELATPKGAGFGVPTSKPMRTAAAALLGMFLGCLAVLVIERVDPRIHLRAGAERAFKLPVIGEIPFASRHGDSGVATTADPASAVAEAYRAVRSHLLLVPAEPLGGGPARPEPKAAPEPKVTVASILGPAGQAPNANGHQAGDDEDEGPGVVLVTSAAPGEGKTATVANLAAGFAETGRSVLVLSFDLRRPAIHQYLGVRPGWGLTDVLSDASDAPLLADVVKDTDIPGVRIATNGSPLDSFGEVAAAGRQMVADARALADIVIIDTAPLLVAHEATELVPAADAVVVVCRSGQTTKDEAGRTRTLLTRLGARVAGVVLVGAPEADASYSTYYYSQDPPGRGRRSRRSLRPAHRSAAGPPAADEKPARKQPVV